MTEATGLPGEDPERERLESLVALLDDVITALDGAGRSTAAARADSARALLLQVISEIG